MIDQTWTVNVDEDFIEDGTAIRPYWTHASVHCHCAVTPTWPHQGGATAIMANEWWCQPCTVEPYYNWVDL